MEMRTCTYTRVTTKCDLITLTYTLSYANKYFAQMSVSCFLSVRMLDIYNISVKETVKQKYLEVSYMFDGKEFRTKNDSLYDVSQLANVVYIPESTYTELTGQTIGLKSDEIAVKIITTTFGSTKTPERSVTIHEKNYTVKEMLENQAL